MPEIISKKSKSNIPPNSNIERLIKENLEFTKQIHEYTNKTRKYILFAQILSIVKIIIIVGPIILAILYLPPLLSGALDTYSELLGGGTGQTLMEGNSFLNQLLGGDTQN